MAASVAAVTVLTVLLLPLLVNGAMTWAPCEGASGETMQALDVVLTPDPPVIGSPATFTVTAHSSTEVTSGTVDITISFLGIQIFSKSEDLCSKTACPIKPGNVQIVLVEDLPPIAPPGEYGLLLQARSGDSEVLCLNVDFELVLPSIQDSNHASSTSAAAASKWHETLKLSSRLRGQATA